MPLAFHAGEMDGPDKNIRETLILGANRIGHGVNIPGAPDTLLHLQMSDRVLIEINLISNQLFEYVLNINKHPFPELLRTRVPVCLNTDDRGRWDANMTDEYYTAMTTFNLSWPELTSLARYSLQHAFVESPVKEKLLADYKEHIKDFEKRYASGSIESALKSLERVSPVTYGYAPNQWRLSFD